MDMPRSQEEDYIPLSSDDEDFEHGGELLDIHPPLTQISDRPPEHIDEDRRLEDRLPGLIAHHVCQLTIMSTRAAHTDKSVPFFLLFSPKLTGLWRIVIIFGVAETNR